MNYYIYINSQKEGPYTPQNKRGEIALTYIYGCDYMFHGSHIKPTFGHLVKVYKGYGTTLAKFVTLSEDFGSTAASDTIGWTSIGGYSCCRS